MTDTAGMIDRASLEKLAAGLLMIGIPGTDVPAGTRELIDRGVRSFILFAHNIGATDQIRSMNAELRALAGPDTLIAIDHEGGRVNRLGGAATPWPSPMAWAATGDIELARRASTAAAQELAALGFNLNFAPVADLLGDHRNPVLGVRCFSDDPQLAARFSSAFIEGSHDGNVAATAKHFPGHGGTSVDSHVDMPEVDHSLEELQRCDLVPFRDALTADVDCLMVSHVWYSTLDDQPTPATLSRHVMDLARTGLGFEGVLVTDCMEMRAIRNRLTTSEAVVRAIVAGADLAIISHQIGLQQEALDALTAAVLDGILPVSRLLEANRRLASLRARVTITDSTPVEGGEELARSIAGKSITLVRDEEGFLPLRFSDTDTIGVVTFAPQRPTGIENARTESSRLSEAVRQRSHARAVEVQVGDDAVLDGVVRELREADTVVVGTSFTTGHPRQREVVAALLRSGKRVVVLALSDPFDLLSFPEAPCYLAVYGDTAPQLDAAVAALWGDATARGHLPVRLGDLYPSGHGITGAAG